MREEFEILQAPPFEARGAATDEYIRAFIELWTSDDPELHGDYCDFSGVVFEPKPVQEAAPAHLDRRREPAGHQAGGDPWETHGSP